MKKLLLLALLLWTPSWAFDETDLIYESDDIFPKVCKAIKVNCTNIKPPLVVTTSILNYIDIGQPEDTLIYGMYFEGEDVVFVVYGAPEYIIAHEIAHYIIFKKYGFMDKCRSEELARRADAAYRNTPYDPSWKELYEGCE